MGRFGFFFFILLLFYQFLIFSKKISLRVADVVLITQYQCITRHCCGLMRLVQIRLQRLCMPAFKPVSEKANNRVTIFLRQAIVFIDCT